MSNQKHVDRTNSRLTKIRPGAILSPLLLAGLLFNAACGEFHSVGAVTGANTAAAVPTATPDGSDDGWWQGATPTPTPVSTASPTPSPTPVPTPVATPTPRPTATAGFRVMTYNIKGIPCLRDNAVSAISGLFGVSECPLVNDGWTKRNNARVFDLLTKINELRNQGREPDVILFEEAFTAKNDIFDDDAILSIPARSGYPYFAWGPSAKISNGLDDYWNLVNQNRNKLRGLLSSGLLILSKHPIQSQAMIEYGDICTIDDCNSAKGALHVRVRHAGLGQDIDVFSTHMQAGSGNENIRSIQTDILTSFVLSHAGDAPLVLGGDFNTRLQYRDAEMTKIQSRLNVNHTGQACVAANQVGGNSACTIASGTSAAALGGDKLDHIFANALARGATTVTTVRGEVPTWLSGGAPLSDHDAVIVDLKLERAL